MRIVGVLTRGRSGRSLLPWPIGTYQCTPGATSEPLVVYYFGDEIQLTLSWQLVPADKFYGSYVERSQSS